MGGRDGGTQMYCPYCESVTVCRAIGLAQVGLPSGQRWQWTRHPELQFFRRARQCTECWHVWATVELPEAYLEELVELRDALGTIKAVAEDYATAADSATRLMKALNRQLKALQSLEPGHHEVTLLR